MKLTFFVLFFIVSNSHAYRLGSSLGNYELVNKTNEKISFPSSITHPFIFAIGYSTCHSVCPRNLSIIRKIVRKSKGKLAGGFISVEEGDKRVERSLAMAMEFKELTFMFSGKHSVREIVDDLRAQVRVGYSKGKSYIFQHTDSIYLYNVHNQSVHFYNPTEISLEKVLADLEAK